MELKLNTKYTCYGDFFLSPQDHQVLTLLYQPIMGHVAFSLYATLYNLPKAKQQNHQTILDLFPFSMDEFLSARHKIEGMGLLSVYLENGMLTYELLPPLSAAQFLNDGILRAFLFVQVGAETFAKIKTQMIQQMPMLNEDQSITKRFSDAFDISVLSRIEPDHQPHLPESAAPAGIEVSTAYDIDKLTALLKSKHLSEQILTEALIDVLNEVAFLYKLDEYELSRLIIATVDTDGFADIRALRELAQQQFALLHKGKPVRVVDKTNVLKDEVAAAVEKTEKEDPLFAFFNQNPLDFLQFKADGKPPVPADVRLIEWLYVEQGMPSGVVNVLVDYVLDYTDGGLPKALVEKIAGQWQRKGIKTAREAMEQVKHVINRPAAQAKESQKQTRIRQARQTEPMPSWFKADNGTKDDDVDALKRIEAMKEKLARAKG